MAQDFSFDDAVKHGHDILLKLTFTADKPFWFREYLNVDKKWQPQYRDTLLELQRIDDYLKVGNDKTFADGADLVDGLKQDGQALVKELKRIEEEVNKEVEWQKADPPGLIWQGRARR